MRTWLAIAVVAVAAPAAAQPAGENAGYIGRDITALEIDDCKQTELTKDEIFRQGSEHYERGETLYLQGDYEGAVRELVYSYCLVPSFYTILKDIGQAYERNLDYEKAIGYLERYVKQVPADAHAKDTCSPDPQQDKDNVARRVEVLKKLRAKVYVESSPPGAKITVGNDAGVAARGHSGDTMEVMGGHYEMTIELDGYESSHQSIDLKIGKPYTYFVPLEPKKGRLAIQVDPPEARIFIGDRYVGTGTIDIPLEGNTYIVTTEAPDRITDKRKVEVLADQVKRVTLELSPKPQLGRRQLIAFSTVAGAGATAAMLYAFQNTGLAGAGSLAGGAAGFGGSMFLLPGDLQLGTSNLTVTSTGGGAVLGVGVALLFTKRPEVLTPVAGASAVLGGAIGYYIGDATRVRTGDAALLNSGIVWGSVAGGLFVASFDPNHVIGGGLVLTGLGMGTIGGLLLAKNYAVSRTHAALIDVGGLIGMIGGLAAESLVYPTQTANGPSDQVDARAQEHLANFALGGMAIGLIAGGVLTRNMDNPKIPIAPALGSAQASDGSLTTTFGFRGSW